MLLSDFGNDPLPERKRFGVGIVDAEDPHALLDPENEDAFQLFPQLAPLWALEVNWIDVLVLLWRILGILNSAVRTRAEPFAVLPHIGVVGRALQSDIERHLQAVFARFGDEPSEILKRSKRRVNRFVAALDGPNGPWTADIIRLCWKRVVLALAKGFSYGMNRRKVEHVETHRGHIRNPFLAIAKSSVSSGLARA